MSRSFTIPFDLSRYSRYVVESGSYISTVPIDTYNAGLAVLEVGGMTFMATIPTDSLLVEKFYPVVEQNNSAITIKNTLLPYKTTIGNTE